METNLVSLLIKRSLVPRVVWRLGDLDSWDDSHASFFSFRAESQEPGYSSQLLVKKVVIVKSLVADGRAGPPS